MLVRWRFGSMKTLEPSLFVGSSSPQEIPSPLLSHSSMRIVVRLGRGSYTVRCTFKDNKTKREEPSEADVVASGGKRCVSPRKSTGEKSNAALVTRRGSILRSHSIFSRSQQLPRTSFLISSQRTSGHNNFFNYFSTLRYLHKRLINNETSKSLLLLTFTGFIFTFFFVVRSLKIKMFTRMRSRLIILHFYTYNSWILHCLHKRIVNDETSNCYFYWHFIHWFWVFFRTLMIKNWNFFFNDILIDSFLFLHRFFDISLFTWTTINDETSKLLLLLTFTPIFDFFFVLWSWKILIYS